MPPPVVPVAEPFAALGQPVLGTATAAGIAAAVPAAELVDAGHVASAAAAAAAA